MSIDTTCHPTRFAAPKVLLCTLSLSSLLLFASPILAQVRAADGTILEGRVDFTIDYEDMGALAAMLPKKQTYYFRAGQQRIEMGSSITLLGVEAKMQIQLQELGEQKVAFVFPERADSNTDGLESDLRLEQTEEREEVAGLKARQVDLVDRLDPSNRLPLLVTDQIAAPGTRLHPELKGFPLDYYQPMQNGMGRWRAQQVKAETLDPALFTIPADYQRIELDSSDQMVGKLQELLGGGQSEVKVIR